MVAVIGPSSVVRCPHRGHISKTKHDIDKVIFTMRTLGSWQRWFCAAWKKLQHQILSSCGRYWKVQITGETKWIGWTAEPGSPQCHLPTQLEDVPVSTILGTLSALEALCDYALYKSTFTLHYMRHRSGGLSSYRLNGRCQGDEHPTNTLSGARHSFTVSFFASLP